MKLIIPGNGALLAIDVISYERPNATEYYDSNWLNCKVSCQVGNLIAKTDMALQTGDFVALQKSILIFQRHGVDEVKFATLEEQLQFTIRREKSTHISVIGTISTMSPNSGLFTFEFDAEALSDSTIESLENITLTFPIRMADSNIVCSLWRNNERGR